MKKNIPFNENDLIASMKEAEAHAKGKLTLRTAKLPSKAPAFHAQQIAQIRRQYNASLGVFAAFLNVGEDTVRSWEKGRRAPTGSALRLLEIAREHPELLAQA